MFKGVLHTHYLIVILFLLIYVIKTILLLSNKNDLLEKFTKKVKVPEMIISFLFLATGIYLLTQLSFGSKYDYMLWIKILLVLASIPLAVVGFKKKNKILAAASLLMIVASFGLAEVYHKKKGITETSTTDANMMDGKTLYMANCKLCHGEDGKLGANGASDLSTTTLEVASIQDAILKGKNMMSPVPVTEDQARAIAAYVTTDIKGK